MGTLVGVYTPVLLKLSKRSRVQAADFDDKLDRLNRV